MYHDFMMITSRTLHGTDVDLLVLTYRTNLSGTGTPRAKVEMETMP